MLSPNGRPRRCLTNASQTLQIHRTINVAEEYGTRSQDNFQSLLGPVHFLLPDHLRDPAVDS